MAEISIEELIKLREEGLSYEKISRYLRRQGITENVNVSIITKRIKEYYELNGQVPFQIKKQEIDVDIEILVKLREEGLSYEKISKKMRREGINISPEIVNIKITEYYQKIGKEVIKKTRKSKKKETPNEKKDDLSNIQIVQEELERKKEEKKTENPTQTAFVRVGRPEEHYDNDVKYILMNGMTVNDFIAETGEPEERERIKRVLKKLIFLAWHSEENNRTMDT